MFYTFFPYHTYPYLNSNSNLVNMVLRGMLLHYSSNNLAIYFASVKRSFTSLAISPFALLLALQRASNHFGLTSSKFYHLWIVLSNYEGIHFNLSKAFPILVAKTTITWLILIEDSSHQLAFPRFHQVGICL